MQQSWSVLNCYQNTWFKILSNTQKLKLKPAFLDQNLHPRLPEQKAEVPTIEKQHLSAHYKRGYWACLNRYDTI
jgi:hypothetical protein